MLQGISFGRFKYSGCHLTWRKGHGENALMKKPDRALSNHVWLTEFLESEVLFQELGVSDHSPIVVNTGMSIYIRRPPFHFFNFWTENTMFEGKVQAVWNEQVRGSP